MCDFETLNLQLFADGDGGAGAAATGGDGNNGSAAAAPNPGEQTAQKASWADLMKDAEYKAEYDRGVERAVKSRLKAANATQAAQQPILERIAKQYGKDATDYQGILDAMDADAMDWEALALEKGTTPEGARREYLKDKQLEQANAQIQQFRAAEQSRQAMAELVNQAQALKRKYPGFDLDTEMGNEKFVRLVANHVPVETAYLVVHHDEIVNGSVQAAAQDTKQKIAQSLQSRGARPQEGAMGGKPASTVNMSVAGMSKAEKDAFRAAVRRGEAPWRK